MGNSFRPWPDSVWPDQSQQLLLQACLGRDQTFWSAWETWSAAMEKTISDEASYRLWPLLFLNLQRHHVPASPLITRIRQAWWHFWARDQIQNRQRQELVRLLHSHDFTCMLLKGSALNLTVYPHPCTRPMSDIDLLVPLAQTEPVLHLLQARGWKLLNPFRPSMLQVGKGFALLGPGGESLDLHCFFLESRPDPKHESSFWTEAQTASLGEMRVLLPSTVDQLLHTCEHGLRANPVPPFRWLVDAYFILQAAGPNLDWPRLSQRAVQTSLVRPMQVTLAYLHENLHLPLSDPGFVALSHLPVSTLDRVEYHIRTANWVQRLPLSWQERGRPFLHILEWLPLTALTYYRLTASQPFWCRWRGFWTFFIDHLDLDRSLGEIIKLYAIHYFQAGKNWLRSTLKRGQWRLLCPPHHIATLPSDQLTGFHPFERKGWRVLGWSEPSASVRLTWDLSAPTELELQLWPMPADWIARVQASFQVTLNQQTLPPDHIVFSDFSIFLRVPIAQRSVHTLTVAWQCPPYQAPGDPRILGLPVMVIRPHSPAKPAC
jgi:hypothetical protein